jgi:hypothetical protein
MSDRQVSTNAGKDDEEEFKLMGIPIAGENEGDSKESWERKSWERGDESATDKDTIMNNFQVANWDTSEESKQGEELPRVPHPRTVHTLATEDIVFWVGPRKDGINKTHQLHPISLQPTTINSSPTTQPLTDTPGSPPEPMNYTVSSRDRRSPQ